jgi:hypothetical protein
VVTANHVVERDEEITLGLADGRTVDARLVGRDPAPTSPCCGRTPAAWSRRHAPASSPASAT